VFERFTQQARRVLVVAQDEARLLSHHFIGTEHILLGLIRSDGSMAGRVLLDLGVDLAMVRERVEDTIGPLADSTAGPSLTPRAKKVMELSLRESFQLGHTNIGTEHLLLGLIREGEGVGAQVLVGLGVDFDDVRQRIMQELAAVGHASPSADLRFHNVPMDDDVNRGRIVACSFCARPPPASGQLISGNNAFICENCIRQWSTRLGSAPRRGRPGWESRATSDAVEPGEQPPDPDLARAQIEVIFTDYSALSDDGRSVIRVEKGADLGWAVAAARANRTSYLEAEIVFTVDGEILFTDPEHAAVWYSIFVNGGQVLNRHRGDAVAVDGEWKMARSTFVQLMAMAGVECPPEQK
jgi:hypothetical protein